MRLNYSLLCAAIVTTSFAGLSYANECMGQLYGINAGRGETGFTFELNEYSDKTSIHSKAKFSSAAMAYASNVERLYYVSAPRPLEYALSTDELNLTSSELKSLPIKGTKFKYTRLAYVDVNSKTHTLLSRTSPMYRLAYNDQSGKLYGSYFTKLYEIDVFSGETTLLGEMTGYDKESDMWLGDLAFKDNQLYLISRNSIFSVDITNLSIKQLSKHNLTGVTGAVFNGDDKLIVARKKINDYGSLNQSALYHVDINTGESCLAQELPVEINDLAIDRQAAIGCPEVPLCSLQTPPNVSLVPVKASVNEGQTLSFRVVLSNSYPEDVRVRLTTQVGSADRSDYTFSNQSAIIAAGKTVYDFDIPTIDNTIFEGDKQFTVNVSSIENATGSDSLQAHILENDEDPMVAFNNAAAQGRVDWGSSRGCTGQNAEQCQTVGGIKGNFPGAPAGTVAQFYISGKKIAQKTLPANGFSFANEYGSEWDMKTGEIAWATLTYNGVTKNAKYGEYAQLHNNHKVDCSSGCR